MIMTDYICILHLRLKLKLKPLPFDSGQWKLLQFPPQALNVIFNGVCGPVGLICLGSGTHAMGVYYDGRGAAFTTSMKLFWIGKWAWCPGQADALEVF